MPTPAVEAAVVEEKEEESAVRVATAGLLEAKEVTGKGRCGRATTWCLDLWRGPHRVRSWVVRRPLLRRLRRPPQLAMEHHEHQPRRQ